MKHSQITCRLLVSKIKMNCNGQQRFTPMGHCTKRPAQQVHAYRYKTAVIADP